MVVGLLLCVVPVSLGISSPISGVLSDRYGSNVISTVGLIIVLFGFYTASTLSTETTIFGYIIRLFPLGLGIGIFQSPNSSSLLGAVPKEHLGVVSGMISVSRTLGQTVGISVLGAIWAGRTFYHAGFHHPEGVTKAPVASQIAALQETFLITVILILFCLILSFWKFFLKQRIAEISARQS